MPPAAPSPLFCSRLGAALTSVVALLAFPCSSSASPWTLPQHDLVVSTDYSFARASREYLNDGTNQLYSVGGVFESSTLALSFRYGFTDRFEAEVRPAFKQISFESDPVILNAGEAPTSLQEARRSVIDFDSAALGAADMDMAGRFNLFKSTYLMVTIEGGLKLPLGYDEPQPTFKTFDLENRDFEVADDATLGDGQIDARGALLLGTYVPVTRTFARVDAAYNHRFSAPGDQVLLNGKVGQYVTQHIILVGGARFARTVTEGDSIGLTAVDLNPGQSAAEFDFASVRLLPLYLDRDYTIVEVGAIVHFDEMELRVAWEDVVDGRNYADLRTLSLGVSLIFDDATRREAIEPSEDQDELDDAEIIEEVIIVPSEQSSSTTTTTTEDGTEIIEEVIIEVIEPDGASEGEDDVDRQEERAPQGKERPPVPLAPPVAPNASTTGSRAR